MNLEAMDMFEILEMLPKEQIETIVVMRCIRR